MKKILENGILTIFLAFILAIISLNLIINDSPIKSFLSPKSIYGQTNGIKKIEIEFYHRRIYLNVHLSKPLSCSDVVSALGITPMVIKSKRYTPTCASIDNELIRITYTEDSEL